MLLIAIVESLYSSIIDRTMYNPSPVPIIFPILSTRDDSFKLNISYGLLRYLLSNPLPLSVNIISILSLIFFHDMDTTFLPGL